MEDLCDAVPKRSFAKDNRAREFSSWRHIPPYARPRVTAETGADEYLTLARSPLVPGLNIIRIVSEYL